MRALVRDVMDSEQAKFADAVADKIFERLALQFELLGFAGNDPKSREEIRKDMEFVRSLRKSANAGMNRAVAVVIGLALAGIGVLAALGSGVKISFGK